MTMDQMTLALALNRVVFVPGTATKRFARDMAYNATSLKPRALTEKQAEYLRTAVIRFRRQIPADTVELAKSMEPVAA